jgi:hypothetical protein
VVKNRSVFDFYRKAGVVFLGPPVAAFWANRLPLAAIATRRLDVEVAKND